MHLHRQFDGLILCYELRYDGIRILFTKEKKEGAERIREIREIRKQLLEETATTSQKITQFFGRRPRPNAGDSENARPASPPAPVAKLNYILVHHK